MRKRNLPANDLTNDSTAQYHHIHITEVEETNILAYPYRTVRGPWTKDESSLCHDTDVGREIAALIIWWQTT